MTDPYVLVREMSPLAVLASRIKGAAIRWRYRWLPVIVWRGQQVDVRVTFSEAKIPEFAFSPEAGFPAGALAYLNKGHLAEVERALGEIGVGFDKGGGPDGRDWEWDYSLSGPISVRFVGRARKPERRL
jgi:hypothetical protein